MTKANPGAIARGNAEVWAASKGSRRIAKAWLFEN
jgi:hypothetical protein